MDWFGRWCGALFRRCVVLRTGVRLVRSVYLQRFSAQSLSVQWGAVCSNQGSMTRVISMLFGVVVACGGQVDGGDSGTEDGGVDGSNGSKIVCDPPSEVGLLEHRTC